MAWAFLRFLCKESAMQAVNKSRPTVAAMLLSAIALPGGVRAETVENLSDMVTQGKINLDFRYRYEYVDEDGFGPEAKASTLRSRLGLTSADWRGLSFLLEFSNVSYVGDDDYNSTENGKTQYPVVADPKGTEVNQALLRYGWEGLTGTYGRQVINLGDQRFVGSVAWRQNEQTFDGYRAQWGSDFGLSLDYAYVYNVNRIFGPDDTNAQPAEWHGDINLFRADYRLGESHTFTGFAYSLEINDRSAWPAARSVDNSCMSYGAEYNGRIGPVAARAGYATQSDAGDSQLDYDAQWYVLEASMDVSVVNARVGYEVLGSDNQVGFKTPLATLHKFQGWADKFLVTPAGGIEDLYVGLSGALGPVKLLAVWHDFQAEKGGQDYGSELDLSALWPVNERLSLELKYAGFAADNDSAYEDTDKTWLTVQFRI